MNIGGEQHSDEYKSVNPLGQVPTLVIDDMTLTQSLPIIEYLEETRPDVNPLLPGNPKLRVRGSLYSITFLLDMDTYP